MGRPRQYATPAARQAAYRQRLHAAAVLVDRTLVEQLDTRMAHLQDALAPVARGGNPLAQRLIRTNLLTLLDVLTEWFLTHQPVPSPPLPRASRLDVPTSSPTPRAGRDRRCPSQAHRKGTRQGTDDAERRQAD